VLIGAHIEDVAMPETPLTSMMVGAIIGALTGSLLRSGILGLIGQACRMRQSS
jgi:hypothetical protein